MTGKKKKSPTREAQDKSGDINGHAKPGKASAEAGVREGTRLGAIGWFFESKRPVVRFVSLFIVMVIASYAFMLTPFFITHIFEPNLQINAEISASLLRLFGEEGVRVVQSAVVAPKFSIDIKRGCDALEPAAIYVAAILAFPIAFRLKLPGIILGTLLLLVLNLVRVLSLYYAGQHFSMETFNMLHEDIWDPAFVFLALFFWVLWAMWATRPAAQPLPVEPTNVSG